MTSPTRQFHELRLSITLQSPYLVHGNDPGRYGLHATLLTDPRGVPILPGTLVAGRIAEAWTAHGQDLGGADADLWFGKPGYGPHDGGKRARLQVADLGLQSINGQPFDAQAPRHDLDMARVQIDPDTGSVRPAHLLMVEQVAPAGAELCFEGRWHGWAEAEEAQRLALQLRAALLLQTQLGAWRNVGFGRLLSVQVEAHPHRPATAPSSGLTATPPRRRRWQILTTEPLCIASRSRRGNVFESGDVIPGSALLGAIATSLCQRAGVATVNAVSGSSVLARHFDALRCTHALPARRDGARPAPLPQSLVTHAGQCVDAWRHASPPPVDVHGRTLGPIAFQTDWKDADREPVVQRQGWGTTRPYLRVRTDINADGQAKEAGLFAYQSRVAPIDPQGQPLTRWLFDLDLSAVPQADHAAVWSELEPLLSHGLGPLGKTDARVDVEALPTGEAGLEAVWPEPPLAGLQPGQAVPLLLVSDALLFPVTAVADSPGVDLLAVYREAFDSLQRSLGYPGALHLSHFFATQQLAGGDWLGGRRQSGDPSGSYRPMLLTEAGSVFVLTVGSDAAAAQAVLGHWQAHGLALPPAVAQAHGATWRDHPYLPCNGYGEIAVAPLHGLPAL
ncbi:RAMP superfamily CRISPR-associated protein [Sphaerotilus microaerophilus]|uniref:CRISPR type III-associated protein domain-containing protein n=1 Tax=Sphaerotilus microaerophilus TaxID=2914710 RepID=A0ABN6PKP4_9BURK|nr:RAMP superfamily CRISPR-associated protein [Sphaerotilus sp. FB-5]BDI05761.1 hypothetical protein CATMQ487_27310 [Sphaerotilus sp. FB-5]